VDQTSNEIGRKNDADDLEKEEKCVHDAPLVGAVTWA
jgi:hypothetical protein